MTQLRRLREERDLTRDQLAAKSGVSSLTIRAHELGNVKGTETRTSEALAEALSVPVQALFFLSLRINL
ncbi:helix-turn-helix transcriptional regulator [Deinococcus multiflagellatus]|uniref:Helix-turn-helix transcriptional regulator n=1 Tax=Deinococcus multiflagellatus TaxID=1656887 RepID=A0ABW1ZI44_9DEIO